MAWILDLGSWILDLGSWILDLGKTKLGFRVVVRIFDRLDKTVQLASKYLVSLKESLEELLVSK